MSIHGDLFRTSIPIAIFYHDRKLQYRIRVEKPNPHFAKMLQQAIGGIEGEMRVCLQDLFQARGSRGHPKYRDMLMETGTEELAHVEMLAYSVVDGWRKKYSEPFIFPRCAKWSLVKRRGRMRFLRATAQLIWPREVNRAPGRAD